MQQVAVAAQRHGATTSTTLASAGSSGKHSGNILRSLASNFCEPPRARHHSSGTKWQENSKQHCVIEAEAIENSPILEGEQATTLRSGTMRCAYLAQDRVDISEAIKCLARAMSKPKAGHMTQLQRVARYLKGVPRKALQYTSQEPSRAHMEVHVDSDWAGDTATRRRRSGVIVRRGLHLLRHSSTVQNVIGLSGAESEYYALTKGGCSGLGLQSLFADWNLKLTDSSSAKVVASRRGAGKSTRHVQTRMLFRNVLQQNTCELWKVATGSNPADMQTQRLVRQ